MSFMFQTKKNHSIPKIITCQWRKIKKLYPFVGAQILVLPRAPDDLKTALNANEKIQEKHFGKLRIFYFNT
jgi:hypothetical protein